MNDLEEINDIYCPECGGCGYIGCCGIESFLRTHVSGKTTCINEELFVTEMINYFKLLEDKNE